MGKAPIWAGLIQMTNGQQAMMAQHAMMQQGMAVQQVTENTP